MPWRGSADGLDKFQRYRATRLARGMKLLRLWVPDPSAPGFQDEATREVRMLTGAAEEAEALDFIDTTAAVNDLDQ